MIRRKLSHEHLSAVSAISMTGELHPAVQGHHSSVEVEIPGKLPVIRDGVPIHRSRAVKEYPAQGAARRIRLERLPGYAPELNPDTDEGVWRCLKRVELRVELRKTWFVPAWSS